MWARVLLNQARLFHQNSRMIRWCELRDVGAGCRLPQYDSAELLGLQYLSHSPAVFLPRGLAWQSCIRLAGAPRWSFGWHWTWQL